MTRYALQHHGANPSPGDVAGEGFAKFLRGVTRLSNSAKGDGGRMGGPIWMFFPPMCNIRLLFLPNVEKL